MTMWMKTAAFGILGAAMALTGCDDKGGGASGSGSAKAGGSASAKKEEGGGSAFAKSYKEYVDGICKCADATCLADVNKKFADKIKPGTTAEDAKVVADSAAKLTECTTKATMAAVGSAMNSAAAAASSAPAAGGESKFMKAAIADRKCRKPDESEADVKFKAGAAAAEMEKMKLSDAVLDCFIACKSKDDAEKCQKQAMKK